MIPTVVSGLILMKKRKVMEVFSPSLRKLWKVWELRALAIVSLLVQLVLIVLGKRRRHIPDIWIRVVVWSAYLLADSVATLALGILSNDLGEIYEGGGKLDSDNQLTALWAPFFLLHLGGPDTITAYSLEDNELYLRHLFGLIVQTIVAVYILLMVWTASNLSYLYVLMVLVGSIKYGERTWALWKASSDELQDSMLSSPDHGPNYAKLMDEYSLRHAEGFFVEIEEVKEDQDESDRNRIPPADAPSHEENIIKAYTMFQTFKRLFADLILSYQEQEKSQSLFKTLSDENAFDVIATELGFIYDMLYTKATVIYTGSGIFRRFVTFYVTCIVLVIFSLDDMEKYKMVDIVITFLLLGGAILLEIYAAFALLFSDQTNRWLIEHKHTKTSHAINKIKKVVVQFIPMCLGFNKKPAEAINKEEKDQQVKLPRWSGLMAQYSLLSLCLKDKPRPTLMEKLKQNLGRLLEKLNQNLGRLLEKLNQNLGRPLEKLNQNLSRLLEKLKQNLGRLLEKLNQNLGRPLEKLSQKLGRPLEKLSQKLSRPLEKLNQILEKYRYKSEEPFEEGLRELIFRHVKSKFDQLEEKKGGHAYLRDLCSQRGNSILEKYKQNLEWSVSCEFDQSILIWHIATELCSDKDEDVDGMDKTNLRMSQRISRYMLYLLAVYPSMLPVGIGLIRLRDTRAEAEKFFEERLPTSEKEKTTGGSTASSDAKKTLRKEACKKLLQVKTHVLPIKVKGDRSKSVLFDGCRLASSLDKMTDKKVKWEMIRDMWLEMLTFAANQCRGTQHATQLRRGGELLTHVWLLMAHFGMIEQFQISKGHARALLSTK